MILIKNYKKNLKIIYYKLIDKMKKITKQNMKN